MVDDKRIEARTMQLEKRGHTLSIHVTFARAADAAEQFHELQAMLEAGGEIKLVFVSDGVLK